MRLKLFLPEVKPDEFEKPEKCSNPKCRGRRFQPYQIVKKRIRDMKYEEVAAIRYKCLRCGSTFRAYSKGVGKKQISKRVGGMAIMLYILGLSYGAVAIVLEALGVPIGKTTVYERVQEAAEKVPGLQQKKILSGYKTKAVGASVWMQSPALR